MTGSGVTESSAAMCSLSVSASAMKQDLLLQYLVQIAPPSQLHIHKGGGGSSTSLTFHHHTIHQRNAIVRALVTWSLHGALDAHPHYLAAGQWNGGRSSRSTSAAAAASSLLTYWMSVADEIRQQTTKSSNDVIQQHKLEVHLMKHAFLVPATCCPTVADLDLATALVSAPAFDSSLLSTCVKRWMRAVLALLKQQNIQLPAAALPLVAPPCAAATPMWFDGTEDATALLQQWHSETDGNVKKSKGKIEEKQKQDPSNKNKNVNQTEKKKNDKGAAKTQPPPAPAAADYDVTALDIRVGQIIKVWHHETADKLFCEEIDLGNGEIRQIASGLRPFYQTADLDQARVLVLCNLKKRNLQGFFSHGMVLCASNEDHSSVELVVPPVTAVLGERVQFVGLATDKEPEPESKMAKKKIFEVVAPNLKTDVSGCVVYHKDNVQHMATVASSCGEMIKAAKGMANAHVS